MRAIFPIILVCLAAGQGLNAGPNEDAIFVYLRKLGYEEVVARSLCDKRPDLVKIAQQELENGVGLEESVLRPVTLYRGIETLVENYDAINGRGAVLNADQARWFSTLPETARFYAGLTGVPRAGNPDVLNRGVVLEVQVPKVLLKGQSVSVATKVDLEQMPDESVFAVRVGLGRYLAEPHPGIPGQLNHSEIKGGSSPKTPLITWLPAGEALDQGKVRLPAWVTPTCHLLLQRLIQPLPRLNPVF